MFEICCTGSKHAPSETHVFLQSIQVHCHVCMQLKFDFCTLYPQKINQSMYQNVLMISVIFLKLKRPSFGNMYVHRGIINLTCIVVAVGSRCVCGGVRRGWRVARSTLRVVSHRVGWPFCQAGWCHIRVVKSLFKTLHNPFIHKCFGHMQSMVVLHDTRYSRVTLSVGPRGRRPSL